MMLKMTHSVKGLALTASSIVLSLGIFGTTSAIAQDDVFWDVEFFDESGVVVGDGEFSYDLTTSTFINTDPSFFQDPAGFEVQTALTTSIFSLFGQTVFPAAQTWWLDGELNAGQQLIDRFGEPTIRFNSWLFLDDDFRFAEDVLNMTGIELISETLGVGNWSFNGLDSTDEFISGSGQWTATKRSQSVPEPTATLSLLAFSALGVASIYRTPQRISKK